MAKRQQQNGHQRQIVAILMTTCLIVISLLMKLDGVSAASISLNGNGNLLQQQSHAEDSDGDHNYAMDQQQEKSPLTHSSSLEVLDDPEDDSLKGNSVTANLDRSQLIFGPPFQSLELVKRASGGFIGMRGKKDFKEEEDNDNAITFPWEQIQNSNEEEEINWDDYAKPNGRRYKKAPTAFYGVRGKKYASINGGNPSYNNNNQRWKDFLQKMEEDRVRDIVLQEFFDGLTGSNDLTGDMAKRAPTGFTGMRGKRPSSEDVASSMESMAKRGLANNAFVGVRGKKDVSHQTFKRSPNSESSSVGGGKRQRFTDFGNKFVAVRGKKNSYELNDNMARLYHNNNNYILPSSAAVRLLYANSDKRTPSGFLGMRGKRPFASDEV